MTLKIPLALRVRPKELKDVFGLKKREYISRLIESNFLPSMIFFGPPGTGKSTVASIMLKKLNLSAINYSAVTGSIKEVKEILKKASERFSKFNEKTVLFVDEIHHFNKLQQDAFLPYIEKGIIVLLGATIENPSFYLNRALLSRVKVIEFLPLTKENLKKILKNAIANDDYLKKTVLNYDEQAIDYIAEISSGDARVALNHLEEIYFLMKSMGKQTLNSEVLKIFDEKSSLKYDKKGDEHYNLVSAFIKSMRGSSPDAALYYLARMLESGEDPLFILRRLLIFACEDVGMADPRGAEVAASCHYAFTVTGMPEGFIPIAFATVYLATAPKSNSSYRGYLNAKEEVSKTGALMPPKHILNPHTSLMKKLGYGKGYQYPHDSELGYIGNISYLPDDIKHKKFYFPKRIGYEKKIIEYFESLKRVQKKQTK